MDFPLLKKEMRPVPEGQDLQIRLDPRNPGQFFACCGLFELLSWRNKGLMASFAAEPALPCVAWMTLHSAGGDEALREVLTSLRDSALAFPESLVKVEPAVNPSRISCREGEFLLDWWMTEFYASTRNLKCWAGQVTTRNLFTELVPLLDVDSTGEDLFERSAMTKSKFGVDPRSAWNALDFGFSPNEHGSDSATYPAVEVLAAIGLQYFRPDDRLRSGVGYSLWRTPLPPSVARLAFRSPWDGLPAERYSFEIRKRGQSYKYFAFAVSATKERTR